ncbi:MAG: hypothetical protein IIB77_05275 [Proteobacteria bacterium]|nr:hypothetical protein [Pseudomonadota bacterium]
MESKKKLTGQSEFKDHAESLCESLAEFSDALADATKAFQSFVKVCPRRSRVQIIWDAIVDWCYEIKYKLERKHQ